MENESGKIEKIKESFQKGLDNYLTNIELMNAICQIPKIGPAIDFMITKLGQEFQKQRMIDSIIILHEEVERLDETKLDTESLKEEWFFDLFNKTFDNCVKTRFRERIRLNCKILAGAISLDNVHNRQQSEDFLSLVTDLTPTDIMVGLKIYEQQENRPLQFDFNSQDNTELKFVVKTGWHDLQRLCNLGDEEFRIALLKLTNAGLIKEIVGMYMDYTGGLYSITPTFQSLMKFIKLNTNDPLFNIKIKDPTK
jgi:hypothetical protein